VTAACLSSSDAASSVIDVLELLDLSRQRSRLQLSVALAAGTPVFVRLRLPGAPEHVAVGEVLWSVRDPSRPGHLTAVHFTPRLPDAVLQAFTLAAYGSDLP
jgi:hypothetical protein